MTHAQAVPDRAASLPNAQTTVQLFEQLRHQEYTDVQLQRVRSACTAALELFAGCMHTCGKPYIAHCTGAAGAMAALGAPADLVVAGLLHGAYMWGDFGAWRIVLPLKRQDVRRRFGARVERYIFTFHTLPWNVEAITAFSDQLVGLDPLRRNVVLMRLASDLDNMRAGSIQYRADAERARESLRRRGPILVKLADQLGFPTLSRALTAAVAETLNGSVPAELRSDFVTGTLLAPASSRLRLEAVLLRAASSPLRRLYRRLKR